MKYGTLRGDLALLALSLISAFTSSTASAQTPANSWLAWQGCWRADGAPANELLCIVPDGAGVRMVTLENNTVRAESRVIADNKPRPIKQDGCTGSEVARWSADHRRVFLISQLTCEQNIARQVSGVFAITGPGDWVSAQAVTIEGRTATRSVLYIAVEPTNIPPAIATAFRADRDAVLAARTAALVDITEAEINEATANIEASAVQEWLNATGQPYQIAGAETSAPTTMSALDLVSRANGVYQPEVVEEVVERPITYVNTTYVNTIVRSCWDPFYAGYVIGVRPFHFGVSYGRPLCGGHYYSRYSPWGYDLYGWHWIPQPVVIVRGGPTIIRTSPVHIRRGGSTRRDWDDRRSFDDRRDGNDRRDFDGARATRDGYTRGNTSRDNATRDNSVSRPGGVRTRENTDDRSRSFPTRTTSTRTTGSTRSQPTTRSDGGSATRSTRSETSTSSRTARPTGGDRAGYSSRTSSSSSSGRTAKARSSK